MRNMRSTALWLIVLLLTIGMVLPSFYSCVAAW